MSQESTRNKKIKDNHKVDDELSPPKDRPRRPSGPIDPPAAVHVERHEADVLQQAVPDVSTTPIAVTANNGIVDLGVIRHNESVTNTNEGKTRSPP